MKSTSIIFTTLLAIASVKGAAIAAPAPEAQTYRALCHQPGEPCSVLKRAAEAAAEAIAAADPQSCDGQCYRAGEPCVKAKRDALALAEATAEAYAAADPEARPCHAPGASCSIAQREVLKRCGIHAHKGNTAGFCDQPGQPCNKLKRAAEAVAEAIPQRNQTLGAESEGWYGSCWPAGEPCSNQKRALDDVNSLLDGILFR